MLSAGKHIYLITILFPEVKINTEVYTSAEKENRVMKNTSFQLRI